MSTLCPYNNTQEFQQMLRQRDAKFWGHYFLKHINVDLDKNVKAKLSIPKEVGVAFTDGKILKQEVDKLLHLVDAALKEPGLESNYVKHLMQDKRVLMGLAKTVEEMPSYQNETPKKSIWIRITIRLILTKRIGGKSSSSPRNVLI